MFNQKLENYHLKNKISKNLLFPILDKFNFSQIPQLILQNFNLAKKTSLNKLSPQKKQKLILFLIDGLGYYYLKKNYQKSPLFSYLNKNTFIHPLTSVFPSTTAASLATLVASQPPSKHALLEWHLYLPRQNENIITLAFMKEGGTQKDSLPKQKFPSSLLLNNKTTFHSLSKDKINSFVFQKNDYLQTTFSNLAFKSCQKIGYQNLKDLTQKITLYDKKTTSPSFFFIYIDHFDSTSHLYGPESEITHQVFKEISLTLHRNFLKQKIREKKKDTIIIFTSDHGQISNNPQKTIYLSNYAQFKKFLKLNPQNPKIPLSGSPRDLFFHIKEDKIQKAIQFLQNKLSSKAEVFKTKHLIKKGLFGPNPSPRFIKRVGEILILPNQSIWWKGNSFSKVEELGLHGGLTAKEVLIPFSALIA